MSAIDHFIALSSRQTYAIFIVYTTDKPPSMCHSTSTVCTVRDDAKRASSDIFLDLPSLLGSNRGGYFVYFGDHVIPQRRFALSDFFFTNQIHRLFDMVSTTWLLGSLEETCAPIPPLLLLDYSDTVYTASRTVSEFLLHTVNRPDIIYSPHISQEIVLGSNDVLNQHAVALPSTPDQLFLFIVLVQHMAAEAHAVAQICKATKFSQVVSTIQRGTGCADIHTV
jgi:hypothetical protein